MDTVRTGGPGRRTIGAHQRNGWSYPLGYLELPIGTTERDVGAAKDASGQHLEVALAQRQLLRVGPALEPRRACRPDAQIDIGNVDSESANSGWEDNIELQTVAGAQGLAANARY